MSMLNYTEIVENAALCTADIGWSKVENKKDVERLREQCTNMLR